MKLDDKLFIYSILVGICITMLFTLIPIWQLVIIPAIIVGFLNKSMIRAVLGGMLSISVSWIIYIVVGLVSRNVYSMLDQFGALILGEGFGWLMLLIIIILSAIFGVLGGGIGNTLLSLKDLYIERRSPKNSEINATKK